MQTIFLARLRSHTDRAVLQVREVLERDKFKLLQEAESAEATQRAMEKELAKYDNDLAIELTFRTWAERSVALAVERMAANATESWLERAFYCWARRTASNHVRTTTLLSCAESTPILRCACCFVWTHSGHRGRSMSCRPRPTKHWYGRLLKLAKTLLAKQLC